MYSRGFNFREFRKLKNPAKIIIIIALLKKNEDSRILNFVKNPKIRIRENINTQKLPDPQYAIFHKIMHIDPMLPPAQASNKKNTDEIGIHLKIISINQTIIPNL